MSNISKEELKTILLFGIHLAKVDNDFHFMEKKVLRRLSEAIGLSEEERHSLMGHEVSLGHGLEILASNAARELLMKFLCVVSCVDGETTREEVEFVEKVLGRFGGETIFLLPKEQWGRYEEEVFAVVGSVN